MEPINGVVESLVVQQEKDEEEEPGLIVSVY